LDLAVKAARARATLGEISYAVEKSLRKISSRYRTISGVYNSEYVDEGESMINKVRK
jgi:methylmalonyl-CoA mutase